MYPEGRPLDASEARASRRYCDQTLDEKVPMDVEVLSLAKTSCDRKLKC
jgi:hypothetical protein